MQLEKHSKFYYGWKITTENRYLDFNDGSIKTAIIKIGTYTSSELATEIKKQLDSIGANPFTVSFNRSTRKFTISTTGTFSLLTLSGTNSPRSVLPLLGYTLDRVASNTYVSNIESGYQYSTQFWLQSFKDPSTNRRAIDGVINKSSSGVVEVIKYGNESFMETEFLYITNIAQATNSIIRNNQNGLENFLSFIQWCTEKSPVEFMKDESDVSVFQKLILESTEVDPKGLDYDLIELYDKGFPNFFRSGKLKFRLEV